MLRGGGCSSAQSAQLGADDGNLCGGTSKGAGAELRHASTAVQVYFALCSWSTPVVRSHSFPRKRLSAAMAGGCCLAVPAALPLLAEYRTDATPLARVCSRVEAAGYSIGSRIVRRLSRAPGLADGGAVGVLTACPPASMACLAAAVSRKAAGLRWAALVWCRVEALVHARRACKAGVAGQGCWSCDAVQAVFGRPATGGQGCCSLAACEEKLHM